MSDSSQNPFADRPQTAADNVQTYQGFSLRGVPSTVQQVRVSSSLQIMVGGLELLPAAYLLVLAGIVGSSFFKTNEVPAGLENRPIQIFFTYAAFLLGGFTIFIVAVLRIWSGIAGFKFKRRKMAIFASVLGMTSALTMYCSVFSIGMLIYGLIIYFDRNVKRAYEMAEQGMTPDQIRDPRNW